MTSKWEMLETIRLQEETIKMQRESIALLKAANDRLYNENHAHARVNNDLMDELSVLSHNDPYLVIN